MGLFTRRKTKQATLQSQSQPQSPVTPDYDSKYNALASPVAAAAIEASSSSQGNSARTSFYRQTSASLSNSRFPNPFKSNNTTASPRLGAHAQLSTAAAAAADPSVNSWRRPSASSSRASSYGRLDPPGRQRADGSTTASAPPMTHHHSSSDQWSDAVPNQQIHTPPIVYSHVAMSDDTYNMAPAPRTPSSSLPPRAMDRFKLLSSGTSGSTSIATATSHTGPAAAPSRDSSSFSRVSGTHGATLGASTMSLPAQYSSSASSIHERPSMDAVERIDSRTSYNGGGAGEGTETEKRGSRWKLGRRNSRRSSSISSMFRIGSSTSSQAAASSLAAAAAAQPPSSPADSNVDPSGTGDGFFVRSFRTVSRVQQDPVISSGPYESLKPNTPASTGASVSPPLPLVPISAATASPAPSNVMPAARSRPSYDFSDSPRRGSFASASASTSTPGSPRPTLQTRQTPTGSGGSYMDRDRDRAPSPSTISVEAFRFASNARSKSTVSLASLSAQAATDNNESPSTPIGLDETAVRERPRFEPSKSRRSSFRSEQFDGSGGNIGSLPASPSSSSVTGSGVLAPPRPSFAHSRSSSSNSSVISFGTAAAAGQSSSRRGSYSTATGALPPSESIATVASYATAPEDHARPTGMGRRSMSSDAELRFISLYGSSTSTGSADRLTSSPTALKIGELPFEAEAGTGNARDSGRDRDTRQATEYGFTPPTNSSASNKAIQRLAPALAVQPPTPKLARDFEAGASPSSPTTPKLAAPLGGPGGFGARHRTVSAMAASSYAGPQQGKGKGRTGKVVDWNVDSSDSDADSDDDDVPLAQIRSRSSTDLSSPASPVLGRSGPLASSSAQRTSEDSARRSSEVEVLADPSSPLSSSSFSPSFPRGRTASSTSAASLPTANGHAHAALPPKSAMRRPMSGTPGTQRRSVSTLSFPSSASASGAPSAQQQSPAAALSAATSSPMQPRSHSSPSSPMTAIAPTARQPSYQPQHRIVSSDSSGSSSVPRTPNDNSPAVSDLGMRSAGSSGSTGASSLGVTATSIAVTGGTEKGVAQDEDVKRQVTFADEPLPLTPTSARQLAGAGKRASSLPLGASAVAQGQSRTVASSRASLQPLNGPVGGAASSSASSIRQQQPVGHRASMSSFTPTHEQKPSNASTQRTLVNESSSSSSSPKLEPGANGNASTGVFERMKARHKAEALEAIRLGQDLNGTALDTGNEDDDEDDDEPLASLPQRRRGSQVESMMGAMPPMSVYGGSQFGQQQQQFYQPQSSIGGYSPLAMAPPGVDPYLYASLPNDQKMQLHQRSQQMMQMMSQAAMQAKAESEAGWDAGSSISGAGGRSAPSHVRGSMSMSSLGAFGHAPMGFGNAMMMHPPQSLPFSSAPLSFRHQQQPQQQFLPPNARLPPFAPSIAMSQAMFQPGYYAGSAMGMPMSMGGYAGSALGGSTASRPGGGKRASTSVVGTGRRY